MAIRANVVLTDAAATPVNHTFYPIGNTGDPAVIRWIDRTQGIAAGQNRLTLSQRAPDGQNAKTYKLSWKLELPVLAQTSPSTSSGIQPIPVSDHTNVVSLELVMHERASQQERKDALAMIRDLITETIMTNQVENLDLIW
jgi:hypothetical protein